MGLEWRQFLEWSEENKWKLLATGALVAAGAWYQWRRHGGSKDVHVTGYDPEKGRPLGMVERAQLQSCERGNAIMGTCVVVGTKAALTETQIREALRRLVMRHPLLRMRVVRKGGSPWFVPLTRSTVPLKVSSSTDWISTLEDEILVRFDNTADQPLWRVLYLPEAESREDSPSHPHRCVLLFVFDHAIVDGLSCIHLVGDLLDKIEEVLNNRLPSLDNLPLMPPLDHYVEPALNESLSDKLNRQIFWFLANFTTMRKDLIAPYLTPVPNPWVEKFGIELSKKAAKPRTCMSPYVLSQSDTSSLISKCKENKVSVQAVLQTAASFAVCKLWRQLNGGISTPFELTVDTSLPVNVRNHFGRNIEPVHLGMYVMVCLVGARVTPNPRDCDHFWSIAREVHQSIRTQVAEKEYMWFYRVFCKQRGAANITHEELDEAEEKHKDKGGRYGTILMFTNLGDCSFLNRPESSPVKLLERFQAPAEQNVGSVFGNDIVTFEGRLFWNMLYYSNITSRQAFELYAAYTKDNIQRLLNDDWQNW